MEINIFRNARDAVELQPGDVLFHEGADGDVMFAVVEGEIELSRHRRVIDRVGPGGIVGELALIDPAPRSATATARTVCRVVTVDRQHFSFLVQQHPTFALQVMAVMAERLRRANVAAEPVR
ncbi:MAG TPA: cyclic nucleotide-binding domain-containing protein [Acidimicrobiia bacterium]|nr:cyclic nucleotide-binding domain-containing protein [Acidimicrobiia bacterium]